MFVSLCLLVVAFVVIWLSTEVAIGAIEKLANHTRISRLVLSLFVLGTVTSFPEIAVSLNAIALHAPQIGLGNLIGSQIFILFGLIPVLAIASRGLHVHKQMKNVSLVFTLLVAFVPMMALLNQQLDIFEVVIILGFYLGFVWLFTKQGNVLARIAERVHLDQPINVSAEVCKLVMAIAILLLASNTAVRHIIEVAAMLQTPRFLLSLILLPIATNLPELSLGLASLKRGKNDFALGDYMGTLTFNSLLIGLLLFASGGSIYIGQNITLLVALFIVGLAVFWWCCYSKQILSVREGYLLLLVYLVLLGTAGWESLVR